MKATSAVRYRLLALALVLPLVGSPLLAQEAEMAKEKYFGYVPLQYPRIVRQTEGDSLFQLYGDRQAKGYRDEEPKDGIDDERGRLLQALGVRFAPFLIRNTSNVPMDMQKTQQIAGTTTLTIDRWDIHASAKLTGTETVDFGKLASQPCPAGAISRDSLLKVIRGGTAMEDCRVLQLLQEFNPNRPLNERFNTAAVPAEEDPFSVLYWNWPGAGPQSWRKAFESPSTGELRSEFKDAISVYVHPFISTVTETGSGVPTYEFIMQYWFFYPYNDAGNKHEGDWEHINVVISPRSQVAKAQTAQQVRAFLTHRPDDLEGDDPVVIRRIDYYFHENVMPLDYSRPNAYASKEEWRREFHQLPKEKLGMKEIAAEVRFRAWADPGETRVNTHPIGYIGADSKGLELFLYSPGARNQNGHGTYPFHGLFENIGPAASAEETKKFFDHQAYLSGKAPLPSFVEGYDKPERVKLLPDWERIYEKVFQDPEYRRDWAWMVLPIRSGFPAAVSPFAGIVRHAETGNLAPFMVTYNGGWNRNGPEGGYHLYDPHRLVGVVTPSPLDQVQNNLGFLNAPIVALITLPPIDLLYKVVLIPVRRIFGKFPEQYYPKAELPVRVISIAGGAMSTGMKDDTWPALLVGGSQQDSVLGRFAQVDTGASGPAVLSAEDPVSFVVQASFYLGKHFASDNTFHTSRSGLGIDVPVAARPGNPFKVRGSLKLYELAGSIRYSLFTGGFQPYAKLGYGWSWYRVEDITTDGVPLTNPDGDWIRQPHFFPNRNLWPNTVHYGAGVEFFLLKSNAPLPRGLDVSVKAEWAAYHHDLGLSFQDAALFNFPSQPSTTRQTISLIGVVSF
jgi:hypothetical protein